MINSISKLIHFMARDQAFKSLNDMIPCTLFDIRNKILTTK